MSSAYYYVPATVRFSLKSDPYSVAIFRLSRADAVALALDDKLPTVVSLTTRQLTDALLKSVADIKLNGNTVESKLADAIKRCKRLNKRET